MNAKQHFTIFAGNLTKSQKICKKKIANFEGYDDKMSFTGKKPINQKVQYNLITFDNGPNINTKKKDTTNLSKYS